jgi:shikimate kinase
MNQVADTYYLKASTDTILQHLSISKGERPLLKGKSPEELKQFVDEQLEKRAAFYEKAHHIIDVNVLDSFDKIDQIVDTIIETGGLQGSEEASR